ncbi:MAG TPA: UbiA family prenyltransferase [Candidatus Acidoferrales bacterium]|nr:UbiA family prenyltransferase [Candidatus Acidoferrales bacterium]
MNQKFRTLLILGRVSNLPTVWSNCLAGWWLSCFSRYGQFIPDRSYYWKLPLLLLGTSALYTGGMFLNDAFDIDFDRQRRSTRPIPSGAIAEDWVWAYGWAWMALGVLLLIFCGLWTGALAVVLAACIVVYDATHKVITASPWLMGLCRFWVYVIAGTIGQGDYNGRPIWCGAALAFYIVGLSYVARRESGATGRGLIPYWPLILLAAPILIAMLMDANSSRKPAIYLSVVLLCWIIRCVRTVFFGGEIIVVRIVTNLLAGIVFVDWLAIAPQCPFAVGVIFALLFVLTLLAQRIVPAT